MTKQKLVKAIAIALAIPTFTIAGSTSASATVNTMYNLTTHNGEDNSNNTTNPTIGGTWAFWDWTDGWLRVDGFASSVDGGANPVR